MDTGRVLMIQRTPDHHDDDTAQARWEWPGGKLDGGESGIPDPSVWLGAVREWCEETGAVLPKGLVPVGGWVSEDEVYEGFVVQVPHESEIALDPEPSEASAARWWNPEDLEDPAVRDKVIEQLGDLRPLLKAKWEDFHQRTDEIVDRYTPMIRDALSQVLEGETVQAAMRVAYQAQKAQPTAPGSQNRPNPAALSALAGVVPVAGGTAGAGAAGVGAALALLLAAPLALGGLGIVLAALYEEAITQGSSEAAGATGLAVPPALASEVAEELAQQTEITIRGIAETEVNRIADAIAEAVRGGVPMSETIARVDEIVHDAKRAAMIAETEYARAMTMAVRATYRRNNVPEVKWLHQPGACERCLANAAVSPIPINDSWPSGDVPVHPNCRCVEAPAVRVPERPIL